MPSEPRSAPKGARGWSRTAPKEPGYYLYREPKRPLAMGLVHWDGLLFTRYSERIVEDGHEFARIPSPKALEQTASFLRSVAGGVFAHRLPDSIKEQARACLTALGGPP